MPAAVLRLYCRKQQTALHEVQLLQICCVHYPYETIDVVQSGQTIMQSAARARQSSLLQLRTLTWPSNRCSGSQCCCMLNMCTHCNVALLCSLQASCQPVWMRADPTGRLGRQAQDRPGLRCGRGKTEHRPAAVVHCWPVCTRKCLARPSEPSSVSRRALAPCRLTTATSQPTRSRCTTDSALISPPLRNWPGISTSAKLYSCAHSCLASSANMTIASRRGSA